MISNVYGSMQQARRREFWDELNGWRVRWNGEWCVGGDWNAIKFPSEILGCSRFSPNMEDFSNWVDSHSLIDMQINGDNFTWSNHLDT